jgi:hypothetical protein
MLTRPNDRAPALTQSQPEGRPNYSNVTLPPTLPAPVTPAPVAAPPSPVRFPLSWLLEHASAPIQYRATIDVARLGERLGGKFGGLPYTYAPAMTLALQQSVDGTWNQAMLTVPPIRSDGFEGVGTINAVRRLIEYGWDKDSPPLIHARRALFRLLAEDNDPSQLYELAGKVHDDDQVRRGRAILREAAGAALAQAGYEDDPRLRGLARRVLERIAGFLRSPLGQKPWIRVGNQHVLAPEAAPPSMHALIMFAYMPLFRTEHHEQMDRLYQFLTQPLPRQEALQLCGKKVMSQPHLVLGDLLPNRNVADSDVASALFWLELMARLGFLKRNDNWSKLLDRSLDDRDEQGVWHPHKGMAAVRSSNPFVWPSYPLEGALSGDERWTDATFRLGLIARIAGRPIEPV